jgi:hypothetical protein
MGAVKEQIELQKQAVCKKAEQQFNQLRKNLKDVMIEKGMNEEAISVLTGLRKSLIQGYFLGNNVTSLTLFKIVAALEAKIDLVTWIED